MSDCWCFACHYITSTAFFKEPCEGLSGEWTRILFCDYNYCWTRERQPAGFSIYLHHTENMLQQTFRAAVVMCADRVEPFAVLRCSFKAFSLLVGILCLLRCFLRTSKQEYFEFSLGCLWHYFYFSVFLFQMGPNVIFSQKLSGIVALKAFVPLV